MTDRRSTAKNAYDLMSDIRKYILEEPKRIWMGDWLIEGKDRIQRALGKRGPVCGTVGCIAGNASVLTNGGVSWSSAAETLSDGNERLRRSLNFLFYDTEVGANYGTKKYAEIVAKRVADFQKEHKAALKVVQISQSE